ncbi:MAG: tRNA (adenosine(37)-N6)-dimethylallyltransferase MiaA [Burkholderiaceae bacterium]|nr:tRNA (adenosine(37)-N6)-dimethylallyltransferase MiaA [Burkholderiaceae bacterium]
MHVEREAPLALLLGPTASGKSAVAMALAERLPIEIVTVDSAQVYRGMDIGTAKPGAAERAAVPHHLIDIVDPRESYSAARFVADARAAIAQIRARGRLPLLVGGTMLYARALVEGLHPLPGADPALRRRLEDEARTLGWPALHARLAQVDPVTAARLEPGDAQRIQRALEVFESSGRPMSEWLASARRGTGGGSPSSMAPEGLEGSASQRFLHIALEPSTRAVLHDRIAARFRAMIAAGLLDEVRALRARGDLSADLPSMRCVGYRQAWAWLDAGEARIEPLIEAGIAATRQLAKRQLTWLRAMPDRVVVDGLRHDAATQVLEVLRRAWQA